MGSKSAKTELSSSYSRCEQYFIVKSDYRYENKHHAGTAETTVYTEIQTPNTNANGLVSVEIGGKIGFSSIDWANGPYFIKTETDPSGGTDYSISSVTQLLSVPYALYAKTAGSSIPGPKGDTGEQGEAGKDGINGIDGKSAYQTWLDAGNMGSETEFIASLKGTKGEKGEPGTPGDKGDAGTGLTNRGEWVSGSIYKSGEYTFAASASNAAINSMWIYQGNGTTTSTISPALDSENWVEFTAPSGPKGDTGAQDRKELKETKVNKV
ncbi:MAG: collagen-like protein [Bacteroidales bacterium]|nr:collagen-like protein [Bacteroidales bacterium]